MEDITYPDSFGHRFYAIPDGSYFDVPFDTPITSDAIGVNVHFGGHTFDTSDWTAYMDYMEQYVK